MAEQKDFSQLPVPYYGEHAVGARQPIFAAAEEEINLGEYWHVLRKRKKAFLACLGLSLVLAGVYLVLSPPIYTAQTTLLIDPQLHQVLDTKQVVSASFGGQITDYYETQYHILKSRSMAAKVIRDLALDTHPHFAVKPQDGVMRAVLTQLREWLRMVQTRLRPATEQSASEPYVYEVNPQMINIYLDKGLSVQPVRRSRLVKIRFAAPNPQLAARIANTHAEVYIREGLQVRKEANEEAQHFLNEQLVGLKQRVEQAEAALDNYRRQKGVLSLDTKENIVVERLADLNKRLTAAEAERLDLEGEIRLIRQRNYDSLPQVINNSLVQALKQQSIRLRSELNSLAAKYKPNHPQFVQLQEQVNETRRHLSQEIDVVVKGITASYAAANNQVNDLRAKLEGQETTALEVKDAAVQYTILSREADSHRKLYEDVLKRVKEMNVTSEVPTRNVFIADRAVPPLLPTSPQKALVLVLSMFGGSLLGIGLVFLRHHLDNALHSPEEVRRYLHLPSLSVIPDFSRLSRHARKQQRESTIMVGNASLPDFDPSQSQELVLSTYPLPENTDEAYRTLRTAILLSQTESPPKSILFTSSLHNEGKTTTVLHTAFMLSQMGSKVLVIDADLRQARCSETLNVHPRMGLTEVLTGRCPVEEVIIPTPLINVFLLSNGDAPPDPTALVGSKKMQTVLAELQEQYDYILIDSPPVAEVSDAIPLSTFVEQVIMVVDSQHTPRQIVREACARLHYARAKILGVVLNRALIERPRSFYHSSSDKTAHKERRRQSSRNISRR